MIAKNLYRCAGLLALLSASQLAAAPAQQCVTGPEMRGLVTYMLPSVTSAMIDRCGPQLPQGAFLNTRGPQLVSDLSKGQSAAWPAARDAMIKITSRDGKDASMLNDVPESVAGPMIETLMEDRLVKTIKPQDCKDVDRILSTLTPLPSGNFVDLVTEVAIMAARGSKSMPSCPGA